MSEAQIQADIRLALGQMPDVRIFRNNQGMLFDAAGRPVRYGVGQPGGSDLIGIRSVVITPDMVGQRIGVFVAQEIKIPGWRPRGAADKKRFDEQLRFIAMVNGLGGVAGVVHSPEEAVRLLADRSLAPGDRCCRCVRDAGR